MNWRISLIGMILSLNVSAADIKMIVPFPPGGGTDLVARILAKEASKTLNKTIIIENVGGAGGDVGRQKAMRDNVLLFTPNSLLITAYLNNLSYIPLEEFKAVVGVGAYPYLISAHPNFVMKNLLELPTLSKKYGIINIASAGTAGANNLIIEQLGIKFNFKVEAIPHRGTSDGLLTVISGSTPLLVSGIQGTKAHIDSGKLRAVAITTTHRDILMNTIPTVQEMTKQSFNYPGWFGIVAPKNYDRKTADEVTSAVLSALDKQDVKDKVKQENVTIWAYGPKEFHDFLVIDDKQWSKAIMKK
jgi:tripartite-type tricarboxylate transporter receptor subunit TctC